MIQHSLAFPNVNSTSAGCHQLLGDPLDNFIPAHLNMDILNLEIRWTWGDTELGDPLDLQVWVIRWICQSG